MSEQGDKLIAEFKSEFTDWILGFVSEALFVLLPFIVFAIVFIAESGTEQFFSLAEWSMGAAILFGQSVVKMASIFWAALKPDGGKQVAYPKSRVLFFLALFIVLGLVPSMVVLTLVLVSSTPSMFLKVSQVALFVVGLIAFALASLVEWMISRLHLLENKKGHSSQSGQHA